MKIKIVFPPSTFTSWPEETPPEGLAKVAGLLRNRGHVVEVDDLHARMMYHNSRQIFRARTLQIELCNNIPSMISYLNRENNTKLKELARNMASLSSFEGYDLIGISVLYTNQIATSLLLAHALQKELKTRIILGGLGLGTVHNSPFFNLPLMKSILADTAQFNAENNLTSNMFQDQEPDYTGMPLHLYKHRYFDNQLVIPYKVDKGCVYKCGFCIYRVVEPFGPLDPKKAVEEILKLKEKHSIKKFDLRTATINNNYQKLEEFCELLAEQKAGIEWLSYASPSNLDESILSKMRKSGCRLLKFGIESGSDRILALLQKPFNRKKASKVLTMAKEQGIRTKVNFIGGAPHEREQDIHQTIEFIKEHSHLIDFANAHGLKVLAHSLMHTKPNDYKITNLQPIDDNKFSFDEIDGLPWEKKKRQIEYSRAKLQKALYYRVFRKSGLHSLPFHSFLPFEVYKFVERSVRCTQFTHAMWDELRMRKCTYVFN